MTKKLPTITGSNIQGKTPVSPYITNVMGDISKEDNGAARALGLKTTEEKINEIIQQSSNPPEPDYGYISNESYAKLLHEEAREIQLSGKLDDENIISILDQVINLNPKKPWVHFDRGMSLIDLKRYEEAALDFTKELEFHSEGPGVFRSYFERAWANIEMNKVHLAVQDFRRFKEYDTSHQIPAQPIKNLQLNITDQIDKLHEKCRQDYRKIEAFGYSIEHTKVNAEELKSLTTESLTTELGVRYSDLLKSFDQLAESDPERLWFRYDRGLFLTKLLRFDDAILDFTKELEINDSQESQKLCRFIIGQIHYIRGDFAKARPEFEKVLQNQDSSVDDYYTGWARRYLKDIETIDNYSALITNRLIVVTLLVVVTVGAGAFALLEQNKIQNSDHFYPEDIAEPNTRYFARIMFGNLSYDELADHLVENFHKLPEDFFQRLSKSNTSQELREFLDEQQFLSSEIKDGLIENFEELKKLEQDQLPKPFRFRFPKNFLRDTLLKDSSSQNYPNDPARMNRAIENFEDEISKHFHEFCENILKNDKVKPLPDGLLIRVEDLVIDTAKNPNISIGGKRDATSESLQKSSSIDGPEIPSTNPLTLNTQSEPKSAQATSRNTRNLG